MMRYNCKVALTSSAAGAPSVHQVRKDGVSAAEVMILRRLHGSDAVTEIVPLGNDKTVHDEERGKLHERYGSALAKAGGASVASLFGELGKLPGKLPDVESDEAEQEAA